MKRRQFLLGMVATVGGYASLRTASAETTRRLKFGYIYAPDSQLGAGAAAFAADLEKRSNGRLKIEPYPNAVLGGDVEMLRALQVGTIDLAFITGVALPNIVPETGVFNIPFLFRDAAHAHAVLDGPIGGAAIARFRQKQLVGLAWGENGMRHLTNSRRPVATVADLKGLKIRLPQSDVMMAGFKAMGAETGALAFPQLYGALQTGQFDGQENPIATIQASKFNQVQKYLTVSNHAYDPALVVASADVFDELPEADQAALTAAAKAAARASRQYAGDAQTKGIVALAAAGMQVIQNLDRSSFQAALGPVMPNYEAKFGADLIKRIRAAS